MPIDKQIQIALTNSDFIKQLIFMQEGTDIERRTVSCQKLWLEKVEAIAMVTKNGGKLFFVAVLEEEKYVGVRARASTIVAATSSYQIKL